MTAVTGDFEEAVRESNRVLAVRGQVLPATSVPLNLSARARVRAPPVRPGRDRARPRSRSSASSSSRPTSAPTREALERILEADMIVLGPGSLFSSVLPNLLIPDVRDALRRRIGPEGVRLQRGDPARRDARRSPRRSTSRALFAHVGDDLDRLRASSTATPTRDGRRAGWRSRSRSTCAGSRSCRSSSSRRTSSTRPTPTATTRPSSPRRSCASSRRTAIARPRQRRVRADRARVLTPRCCWPVRSRASWPASSPRAACDRRAELVGPAARHRRRRRFGRSTTPSPAPRVQLAARSAWPCRAARGRARSAREPAVGITSLVELDRASLGGWSWADAAGMRSAGVPARRAARQRIALLQPRPARTSSWSSRSRAARATRSTRPSRRWTCALDAVERRGRSVVYLKGQEEIAALFRLSAPTAACSSSRRTASARDVQARLNRLINAEEANLGRTVRAADRQLSAIARLEAQRTPRATCRRRPARGGRAPTPHAGRRSGYACRGARRQPVGGEPSPAAARRARQPRRT